MPELKPCRKCGTQPIIHSVDGLWYSYCPYCCTKDRTASGKVSIYNNLSLSESKAIAMWNERNSKVMSDAQKRAIERQKARYAAKRAEKAAREAAKSIVKRVHEEQKSAPSIIGLQWLKD